ncbi:MAG: UvrD-helicase domain-containing protein [Bacteroidota bacterium]|nr:UvrD-helicase domain-containing protein [Bacteroidota bacterium]
MAPVSSSLLLTAAQQHAVSGRGPLIVSASAGSGKTRVLVERYVRIILEGCDVRRVVAITFTRKAAAEMLDRVARRIEEIFAVATRPEELLLLRTLRERLVSSNISTFHSYCSALLRRFSVEAGIPPLFGELGAAERRQLVQQAIRTTVEQWISTEKRDALAELLRIFGSYRSLERSVERLLLSPQRLESLSRADNYGQYLQQVGKVVADIVHEVVLLWRQLEQRWQSAPLPRRQSAKEIACARDVLEILDGYIRAGGAQSVFDDEWKTVLADAISVFHTSTDYAPLRAHWAKYATPHEGRALRRAVQVLRAFIGATPELEYRAWAATEVLLELARQALVLMDSEKVQLAQFEPDDLQRRAVALLDVETVRDRLRWEIEHVLVDEFQDTDPLEYVLLEKLVPLPATDDVPELFIVGDPKQSIYGFRGADVRVFEQARQAITSAAGIGADIHLQTSFRMTPRLVAFVNRVMRTVMPTQTKGYQVGYEELCTARDLRTCPDSSVALLVAQASNDDPLAEATLVARHILHITAQQPLQVWDETLRPNGERAGDFRAATYRDIAILARKSSTFQPYIQALRAAGIPYRIESGKGFYQTQEVLDVLAFLRVVHNPHDDIALATFLRSPFVGLRDSELVQIAVAPPAQGSFYERFVAKAQEVLPNTPIHFAATLLAELLPIATRLPPAALIRLLLRKTQWYRRNRSSPRARQAEANIEKLLEAARQFEQHGFRNLLDFVEELEQLRIATDTESEAAVISDENVVTLMTIHAAKGLEFPIVYLVGAEEEARGWGDVLVLSDQLGATLSRIENTDTAVGKLGRYLLREREEAEEQRLLYVALTRAKDHLFIAATIGEYEEDSAAPVSEPKGYFGAISRALGISWELHANISSVPIAEYVRSDPSDAGTLVEFPVAVISALPPAQPLQRSVSSVSYPQCVEPCVSSVEGEIISASQLLLFEKSPEEFYRVYRCGLPAREDDYRRALARLENEDEVVGTLAGQVIHRVLEYLFAQDQQFNEASIARALVRALSDVRSSDERLRYRAEQEVRAVLEYLAANELLRDAMAVLIEKPLMMPMGKDFLLGIPDVAVQTPRGWELWDWKTNRRDQRTAAQWLEYYRTQLEVYALLWSQAVPEQPQWTLRLILTRPPVEMATLVVSTVELSAAYARIEQMMAAIKRLTLAKD